MIARIIDLLVAVYATVMAVAVSVFCGAVQDGDAEGYG